MKKLKILLTILTIVMISASSHSQSLLNDFKPVAVTFEGKKGVLISFARMDTISVMAIKHKALLGQQTTTWELYVNEQAKVMELEDKVEIGSQTALKWKKLYLVTDQQKALFEANFKLQQKETKKARRAGFLWFGGGVAVGVGIIGVLSAVN